MKTKNKMIALVEIAIVLCAMFLVAIPAIAADTQKASASKVTTASASEDDYVLGVYGNANEDKTVDMGDVVYIKLAIFGKKDKTELCDAKYDGRINVLDVIQTKLIILGKEKELTLIDMADRVVTIDKPIEKVVITYHFVNYLAVEGGENPFRRIVGWYDSWKRDYLWTLEKYKEVSPEIENIPDIGYPDVGFSENVIALEPDLVILHMMGYEGFPEDVNNIEEAGIPILVVDYYKQTIVPHCKSSLLLGYVLDKEQRAQEMVDFYTERVNEVYTRLENIDKPKPKVYWEYGTDPAEYSWTFGDYMWGRLFEMGGGINIAKDVVGRYGSIDPEYLLDENPDIIIIAGKYWPARPDAMRLGYYADPIDSRERLRAFTERPGWDTLNAVKNNRVYGLHHGLIRNMHECAAVQYLAKLFYPEEFKDLDPEASWKEYHERFLPVDYSGVWWISIEEE